MALMQRKTPQERAAKDAQKQADREAKAREKLMQSFFESPAGQARVAFEEGAQIFQFEADLKRMIAVVKPIGFGSSASGRESFRSNGPVDTLNAVANEGWDLVNGSFVFVETGQVSRNKFTSTGQQVAVAGSVVGYYLFKRDDALKKNGVDPWDLTDEEALELAEQID